MTGTLAKVHACRSGVSVPQIEETIAVLGLGYVGLPLALALSRRADVIAFDIDARRVEELKRGVDSTREVASEELAGGKLSVTADPSLLAGKSLYIVTVPTPLDQANRPDLTALLTACELLGPVLSRDAVVVFESTVYPGLTEEVCGPAL